VIALSAMRPTSTSCAPERNSEELNAALAAQIHGGTAATAEKKNKQEALISILRKLKHYVEDNCGNDPDVLLSSGFQAASTTRDRSPLANPSILSVDLGNSAELRLKVSPIACAKCYEVRMAAMGAGNAPAPWQNAGLFIRGGLMRWDAASHLFRQPGNKCVHFAQHVFLIGQVDVVVRVAQEDGLR
jgi:hypothetical protein